MMNRMKRKLLKTVVLVFAGYVMGMGWGCGMIEGMGRDLQSGSRIMQRAINNSNLDSWLDDKP